MTPADLLSQNLQASQRSPDEEYAYAVGKAAGTFLNLKHSIDSSYRSAAGLLTYARYDKRVLESIVKRILRSIHIMLQKGQKEDEINDAKTKIDNALKDKEISDARQDYAYFFQRGALSQIGEAKS